VWRMAVNLAIRLSCSRPTRQGRPVRAVAARSAFAALDPAVTRTDPLCGGAVAGDKGDTAGSALS
jgi:hypothetical protein